MRFCVNNRSLGVLAAGLCFALSPALALEEADLAGTSWILRGTAHAKVKGMQQGNLKDSAAATLSFQTAGVCGLAINLQSQSLPVDAACGAQLCIPCSWATGPGKSFTLDLDQAALNKAVTASLGAAGIASDRLAIAVSSERAAGALKNKKSRLVLKTAVKADITVPGLPLVSSRYTLNLNFTGTQASN